MRPIIYRHLTLKPQYRERFLKEAKAKFPRRYARGLQEALNENRGPDMNQISDDTVRRILSDGRRGIADNVVCICDFFEVDWYEACEEGKDLAHADIDERIKEICQKCTLVSLLILEN